MWRQREERSQRCLCTWEREQYQEKLQNQWDTWSELTKIQTFSGSFWHFGLDLDQVQNSGPFWSGCKIKFSSHWATTGTSKFIPYLWREWGFSKKRNKINMSWLLRKPMLRKKQVLQKCKLVSLNQRIGLKCLPELQRMVRWGKVAREVAKGDTVVTDSLKTGYMWITNLSRHYDKLLDFTSCF